MCLHNKFRCIKCVAAHGVSSPTSFSEDRAGVGDHTMHDGRKPLSKHLPVYRAIAAARKKPRNPNVT